MSFPTPTDAFKLVIKTWEGEFTDNPADRGNWLQVPGGAARLVGTMRGVTAAAYCRFAKADPATLTADELKQAVTLDVAAKIFMVDYFQAPGLDHLTWSPLVEIVADIGWGSGTMTGIKMLQRQIGTDPDGRIGPQTAEALDLYLEQTPIEDACRAMVQARCDFYISISQPGTKNAQFRKGWLNRANWASPDNAAWWSRWPDWRMPFPAGSSKPTGIAA